METIKHQTRAMYDCLVAGQSPLARGWTVQTIGCRPMPAVYDTKTPLKLRYAAFGAM